MGFHHIDQADLKLLTSSDPPALASQSTEITGMNYDTWPEAVDLCLDSWYDKLCYCSPPLKLLTAFILLREKVLGRWTLFHTTPPCSWSYLYD